MDCYYLCIKNVQDVKIVPKFLKFLKHKGYNTSPKWILNVQPLDDYIISRLNNGRVYYLFGNAVLGIVDGINIPNSNLNSFNEFKHKQEYFHRNYTHYIEYKSTFFTQVSIF